MFGFMFIFFIDSCCFFVISGLFFRGISVFLIVFLFIGGWDIDFFCFFVVVRVLSEFRFFF